MGVTESKQAGPFAAGCRFCGRTDLDLRRGLCDAHYQRFIRKRKAFAAVSVAKAEDFEKKCVEQGWIETAQARGRPASIDAFDQIAAQVDAEFKHDLDLAFAKEQAAELKSATKKRATKKKAE